MTKTQQIIAGLIKHAEKTAMHGYPDYQMTEPQQPPLPQMSIDMYGNAGYFAGNPDPDPMEEAVPVPPSTDAPARGLLSGFPGRFVAGGAMAGSFAGKSLVEDSLKREGRMINFLQGKGGPGSPVVQDILLKGLEKGKIAPDQLSEARAMLTDPNRLKNEYFKSPGAWEQALKKSRKAYWQSMGKGPGLGILGGAALGLGAGVLYNKFFNKESADRGPGLLSKFSESARTLYPTVYELQRQGVQPGRGYPLSTRAFKAPPPKPEFVETAWRGYTPKPSPYAATALHEVPMMSSHPLSRAAAVTQDVTRAARIPALQEVTRVGKGILGVTSRGRIR